MGYIDYKCTMWARLHIDDEDLETQIEILKTEFHVDALDWDKIYDVETLNETGEFLYPADNGGEPTIEIANSDGEILYNNA